MNLLFQRPVPITDALMRLGELELLPTDASAADIRQWSRDIRAGSLFSARTTHLGYLQEKQDVIGGMLKGEINMATGTAILQDTLDQIGYAPETGFPGDTADVPPADRGSLRDLSSNKRLKLILETQTRRAANFAYRQSGMAPEARHEFPAWELVRIYEREEERDDWEERFVRAGGRLVQGRMIALKDDLVWSRLGDSSIFQDGMDSDVPPYAFNSGMGWDEIAREECLALGLINGDETPGDVDARFFDEDKLNAAQFEPGELSELLEGLRVA